MLNIFLPQEMPEMAKYFGMMEALGHTDGETMRVNGQVAIDSIGPVDAAVLIRTTRVAEVLRAITELPSVPLDEENGFVSAYTNVKDAVENVIAIISRRQTKSLTVNGPSTHPGIPMDRHTQGSVSRYPDAFRNPKPHRHRCRRKASAQISAQEDPEKHRQPP